MPREIRFRERESGLRNGFILFPLALPRGEEGYVRRVFRPLFGLPLETFQDLFVLFHLDHRIGIALDLLEIIEVIDIALLESGREHLRFELVDRSQGIVLFYEEQSRRPSQRIEALEGTRRIEICHHLRTLDLVEADRVLLDDDEGIRHQAGPVDILILDDHRNAVRSVLAPDLIPNDRILVEPDKGIKVVVFKGVAYHLHVVPKHLDVVYSLEEADLGGILRNIGQGVLQGRGIRRCGPFVQGIRRGGSGRVCKSVRELRRECPQRPRRGRILIPRSRQDRTL